jgi:hypothetical protein
VRFEVKTWICSTLANFYAPFLGAARTYAYVKKQGHDVHFKDINQNAYFNLLSRGYLKLALERVGYAIDSVSWTRLLREELRAILTHSLNNAMSQCHSG